MPAKSSMTPPLPPRSRPPWSASRTSRRCKINVDTANGVVTLSGAVDSPSKVDRATQVAQAVQGVKSVDNRLTVKQG